MPYRFFGLSESLSWLAQFMGQGFEDLSALANLVLLQQFMLAEEYQLIAGSSQNLPTPVAPTLTARTRRFQRDRAVRGCGDLRQRDGAELLRRDDQVGAQANVTPTASQVVDVTITPVAGAQQYNIYMGATTTVYLHGGDFGPVGNARTPGRRPRTRSAASSSPSRAPPLSPRTAPRRPRTPGRAGSTTRRA